jgi:hypothetical protein
MNGERVFLNTLVNDTLAILNYRSSVTLDLREIRSHTDSFPATKYMTVCIAFCLKQTILTEPPPRPLSRPDQSPLVEIAQSLFRFGIDTCSVSKKAVFSMMEPFAEMFVFYNRGPYAVDIDKHEKIRPSELMAHQR